MLKIYTSGDSRSRRALWALEEVGAAYEVHELRWPPRIEHPDFLKISPAGTVPTIVDGEIKLSESLAICEYVSRRFGGDLVVEPDHPEYYRYLELAQFGEGTLMPPLAWARRFGPMTDRALAEARSAFAVRLAVVEQALADGREFLVADRLTVADLSVGFAIRLSVASGLHDLVPPLTHAYELRLHERPACQRAYAV